MIEAPLRALAARMARDRRLAAAIEDPELAAPSLGLAPGELAVLRVLADARAAYRLGRGRLSPAAALESRRAGAPPGS